MYVVVSLSSSSERRAPLVGLASSIVETADDSGRTGVEPFQPRTADDDQPQWVLPVCSATKRFLKDQATTLQS